MDESNKILAQDWEKRPGIRPLPIGKDIKTQIRVSELKPEKGLEFKPRKGLELKSKKRGSE